MREELDRMAEALERGLRSSSALDFPAVAARVLEKAALPELIDACSLATHVLSDDYAQHDLGRHRSPTVIPLISTPHFKVAAHLWLDDIADVHTHDWSGAFQVVCGEAIHAQYAFTETELLAAELRLGELEFRSCERLRSGDVVPVEPGFGMAHAVCHIPRPSLTVSVRRRERGLIPFDVGPQVAAATRRDDAVMHNRFKLLAAYRATSAPRYLDCLQRLLLAVDTSTGYFYFRHLRRHADLPDALFCELGDAWAGELEVRRRLLPSLVASDRHALFTSRWQDVHDSDLRLFLALSFVAPDRQTFMRSVQSLTDGEPRERVLGWLDRLGELLGVAPHHALLGDVARALFVAEGDVAAAHLALQADDGQAVSDETIRRLLHAIASSPYLTVLFG